MRIAFCVNFFHPSIGGSEAVVEKLAIHFSQQHEVSVFTRYLLNRKSRKLNDISIFDYDPTIPNSFINPMKKFNPEFIIIYSDVFDFFLCTIREFKNICLMTCGGNRICDKPRFLDMLMKNLKNIRSFVCHTIHERDYKLIQTLNLLSRTHIIPIGIDIDEFDNNSLTRDDLIPEQKDSFWILNVSNFFPGKGQDHLLKILPKVTKRPLVYIQICSDLNFAFAKQFESQWNAQAKKLSDPEIKIILLKNKPRNEVVGFFKNSNVFAFSSEKESVGLVLLEAMASEIPWVSAQIGIAPELKGGFVIGTAKNRSYNAIFDDRVLNLFASKIDNCFDHPELGQEGKKQINEKFDWNKLFSQYEQLYHF